MNVVFLSPHFPPQFFLFCQALQQEGAQVLAIADTPWEQLRWELRDALTTYYQVGDMERYDEVVRAMGYLIHKHGRIDRVDSLNEHWLELEARLREDFNIPGQRPADTQKNRSKTGMKELFRAAGVPCTEGERLLSRDHAWALAQRLGYPLVFKPDVGVGAARTFKVSNDEELAEALTQPLAGYVVEKFEPGTIVSFDGLAGRDGRILFCVAHRYSAGVMDVVNQKLTMFYYSLRRIPPRLEELGRKAVEGFGIKERFFHFEFFEQPGGVYKALEVNVRPPGGFTTDMMNFTCDFDVYSLWAKMLTGKPLEGFHAERRWHVAHVGRRNNTPYRLSHEQVLQHFGDRLVMHRPIPPILAGAMGDYLYMLRDEDEGRLLQAIETIAQ